MANPPNQPIRPPSTAFWIKSDAISFQGRWPENRISTSTIVRKIANGSLMPDSTSSVALTRGRSRKPLAWSRKNTAAASVEAITAPTRSDSVQVVPSIQSAIGAVSVAVISTPTVASRPAGPSTLRTVASLVRKPPSNRIRPSATQPTV